MIAGEDAGDLGKRTYYPFHFPIGFSGYNPKKIILLQYTGLKDCKRHDIYEGDILRLGDSLAGKGSSPYYPVGVVEWTERLAGYEFWDEAADHIEDLVDCAEDAEVIGNIYENPELLKVCS